MKKFSLLVAIQQDIAGKSYSSEVREVLNRGKENARQSGLENESVGLILPFESRDLTAASGGSDLIQTNVFDLVTPLRNALVLIKAGATLLTNITNRDGAGNILIPTYAGSNVSWENEIDDTSEGSGLFSSISMKPKRLTAEIIRSKQFLLNTSPDTEDLLRQDLMDAIAEKLENTILGKADQVAKQPNGLYTGITDQMPAVKGSASWDNVLTLESLLDNANARRQTRAYITNGPGSKVLKQTPKLAGQAHFLYENGLMNEYPVFVTNNMASGLAANGDENGLAFGNWQDLIIAQFGAIDIIVDPFSLAGKGEVKLIVNSYWDVAKRYNSAFAIGSVK